MADIKDTGVTVADENIINDILPFCAQGVDGRDLLAQSDYAADVQRTIGHQPGIARQELANKQARQASHIAAGLAQFLARRYAPGVKDDGDLDRIESAIVEAIYAIAGPKPPRLGVCATAASTSAKEVSIEDFSLDPGVSVQIVFSAVNTASTPTLNVAGTGAKPITYSGVAPEVGQLAQGQVYTLIYSGSQWQIIGGMSPYPIGQYTWWEDGLVRPGFQPANANIVSNFAATYPQMAAYLSTAHGANRCFASLAEYEAAHAATWATLADGSKVGWENIGGVAKFFWNKSADTLLMPDLTEMTRFMAGASLGVGAVQGDAIREIYGDISGAITYLARNTTGTAVFNVTDGLPQGQGGGSGGWGGVAFRASRVVPVGSANAPRRWGALACCYLGQPTS